MKAAFAQIDITPPVGTQKIGWKKRIVAESVLDPLFARAAVFAGESERIAFIQLDVLCVRWNQVAEIRERISRAYGFPGENVMVAATHNHAGPAVANLGDAERDDAYVESLVAHTVSMFGQALETLQAAQIGWGRTCAFDVGYNRRVRMRDGTVKTHGRFSDPLALCLEGPIDPELAVLAARSSDGRLLGAVVNFACHPAHHGGDTVLSAGYPGVLAREMDRRGCPVTLFLNGAAGNIATSDPLAGGAGKTMEEAGEALAGGVSRALEEITYQESPALECRSATIELPFREISDDEIHGTTRGAQRFIDTAIYDREIPRVLEQIRQRGTQKAQVQALLLDGHAYVGIPGEYFVELGLRIKERTHPRHTLVVGYANGMVGYVPHREAFARGGYETTFCGSSKLAPPAGDLLADCAIKLLEP